MKELREQVFNNRLVVIKKMIFTLGDLKDNITDKSKQQAALEKMLTVKSKIRKQKVIGHRGATSRWPVHVIHIILKLLLFDLSLSDIPKIMQTLSTKLVGEELHKVPSRNFV